WCRCGFFFSSRRRHTRSKRDWSSDVCSSDLNRFGHAMGSKALREVSRRLVSEIRGSDKLFRYGGDEFCVVLPETDLRGACELSERLRVSLASRSFLVDDTPGMTLTASFGIAAYPDH